MSSLFLSTVWALDDLGVKFYFGRTGEIRMAGSSIGTVIPLITGAIGITSVFHSNLPMDAFHEPLPNYHDPLSTVCRVHPYSS